MKRNLKVIQINGFRGIFMAFFVLSCLIAGFVAFPAFLSMGVWNFLADTTSSFPAINFAGGLLLWAIIAFSFYIFNKRRFIVSLNTQQELSDFEVSEMISKIKSQTVKSQTVKNEILKPKDLKEKIEEEHSKK